MAAKDPTAGSHQWRDAPTSGQPRRSSRWQKAGEKKVTSRSITSFYGSSCANTSSALNTPV
eukprot:8614448-Pyramimonas_sp.AAC.1